MTADLSRAETAATIKRHGVRWIVVKRSELPRWAYSIGLTERGMPEVVLAGGAAIGGDQLLNILSAYFVEQTESQKSTNSLADSGWRLGGVDRSWEPLTVGANRYYGEQVAATQLIPPPELWTLDVPDLSVPWDPEIARVWRWIDESQPWNLPCDRSAVAFANLAVLQKQSPPRTAGHWEPGEWEVFSYSDAERAELDPADIKPVPLASLIADDPSLEPLAAMEEGEALIRASDGRWHIWE